MTSSRGGNGTRNQLGWRVALLVYGFINAMLYASLLPLWEGFDEPFHYGYVQELSRNRKLPQLGKTPLSQEICRSLALAPASHVVKQNLPLVTTFTEYFQMPVERQTLRRSQLTSLDSHWAAGTCATNYEAHQAPLAYVLLAGADAVMQESNLVARVWRLRLLCALLACFGTAGALFLLANRLHLPNLVADTIVFAVLSSQMFYATTAHIANDWLAVPLMVLLFERLIAAWENPTGRNILLLAIALSAGLLTKAYFLALLPVAAGAVVISFARRRLSLRLFLAFWLIVAGLAGPWYLRNIRLYRNVSGMQETKGGVDFSNLLASAKELPWVRSSTDLLLHSLWTGNNSFGTFSRLTLGLLLAGYFAAAASFVHRSVNRRLPAGERILLCGCLAFAGALVYSTIVSFWATSGAAITASPWYTQAIAPVVSTLLFCGLTRFRRLHLIIAMWIVLLSAYLICATYWVKLVPLYGGYPEGRSTLSGLIAWYTANPRTFPKVLSLTALGAPELVLGLSTGLVLVAIALAFGLCTQWVRHRTNLTQG